MLCPIEARAQRNRGIPRRQGNQGPIRNAQQAVQDAMDIAQEVAVPAIGMNWGDLRKNASLLPRDA